MAGFPIVQDGDSFRPDPDESPRGVNSVLPGVMADAGSRDPASTTVAGSIAAAMANMAEMQSDAVSPIGSPLGDPIDLPSLPYKEEGPS
jgi:hypothetical protein